MVRARAVLGLIMLVLAGCQGPMAPTGSQAAPAEDPLGPASASAAPAASPLGPASASAAPAASPAASPAPPVPPAPQPQASTSEVAPLPTRPAWLGTRVLPLRPDGFGEVLETPLELRDRRLPTPDVLPPPADELFAATVVPVPDDVVARSTWAPDCPVTLDDLRYVTVAHWGFDGLAHTGELLVHAEVAEDLVTVFGRLFEARFPIEQMRVVTLAEFDAAPTGDGNNTSAFVCRPTVAGERWSEHAYGLALDLNPFHNPYVRGDLVLPELASAYVDRDRGAPGMVQAGDVATAAFAAIGWGWGGAWHRSTDSMHFSRADR